MQHCKQVKDLSQIKIRWHFPACRGRYTSLEVRVNAICLTLISLTLSCAVPQMNAFNWLSKYPLWLSAICASISPRHWQYASGYNMNKSLASDLMSWDSTLIISHLTVLPESTSMVHVQRRLLSYGNGYPGDSIRPDDSPLKLPPHSATIDQNKKLLHCQLPLTKMMYSVRAFFLPLMMSFAETRAAGSSVAGSDTTTPPPHRPDVAVQQWAVIMYARDAAFNYDACACH